jgi:spermidine synthase
MKNREYATEVNPNGFNVQYKISEVLFTGQSEFQKVEVVQTEGHGKMLLNDDLVMITERDEFVYHDMITHVALFTHPSPKKVLVIGGGDGGTAREVLRHRGVEQVDMVEIDKMVVDACREHIPQTAVGMIESPRFNLYIDDGVKFVKDFAAGQTKGQKNSANPLAQKKYDVIIVDSTDPIGPATPLFGPEFYKDIHSSLADDGIVVSQGESPYYNRDTQISMSKILSSAFPILKYYNFTNLTYPGGLWSFSFASKKYHPVQDFNPSRVEASGLKFKYYTANLHSAAFQLPQFQLENIGLYLKT